MSYAIVYDSRTGNTEALARAVAAALPSEGRLAFGRVDEVDRAAVAQADRVYAGFWTNRGDCGDELAEVLASLADKDVFLFGTAGFGADETYFAGVMARVAVHLPESARIVGTFMCQGRMPMAVRERYEKMLSAPPSPRMPDPRKMLENFDRALPHPDEEDLARFKAALAASCRPV